MHVLQNINCRQKTPPVLPITQMLGHPTS
jgi:hypothetical protein